jgi:predicted MPP superfamily phosphohydrolase
MSKLNLIEKDLIIPGLKNTYRILHVTDAHITKYVDADEETVIRAGLNTGKHLVSGFAIKRVNTFTKNGVTSCDGFAALCESLREAGPDFVDLVLFTGDILDYYTDSAFAFMLAQLAKLPMPYMFVLGNHDWIFSHFSDEESLALFSKTLCGGDYRLQKYKLGELTLIGTYDGDYYYSKETLSMIEQALEGEEHVLLCQHVPITTPDYDEFVKKLGGRNVVIGADECPVKDDSYDRIMALLQKEDCPIRALLCGDSHIEHSGPLTERVVQHISPMLPGHGPVLFTVKGE